MFGPILVCCAWKLDFPLDLYTIDCSHTHMRKRKSSWNLEWFLFKYWSTFFFCWPFDLVSSPGGVRLNIFTREKKKMQTYLKLYPSNLNFSSVAPCMDISRCMFITDISSFQSRSCNQCMLILNPLTSPFPSCLCIPNCTAAMLLHVFGCRCLLKYTSSKFLKYMEAFGAVTRLH